MPHFISPDQQLFHPDDLFLRYARFNSAPLAKVIYHSLSRLGGEIILWGKLIAALASVLTTALLYATGRLFGGRVGGWTAAIVFQFFPNWFRQDVPRRLRGRLVGHFHCRSRSLLTPRPLVDDGPAVCSGRLSLPERRHPDMGHDGFSGMPVRRPPEWRPAPVARSHLLAPALGSTCGGGRRGRPVIGVKYLTPNEFGDLVTRVEIGQKIEFTSKGRGYLIPTDSLLKEIDSYYGDPFHYALAIGAFIFLGRRMLSLPRGVGALFLSAIVLYALADVFMLRLYFPDRYLQRALPLVACLASGFWLGQAQRRVSPWSLKTRLLPATVSPLVPWIILLVVLGIAEFNSRLDPDSLRVRRYRQHELYQVLRELPGRPMIAVNPNMSEIPLMTGKSVVLYTTS